MASTVEARAAALLEAWIAERGTTPSAVAERLGLEPAAVERMVSGREPLELARLERVLAVLGVGPAEFFGRLYGPGEAGTAPASTAGGAPAAVSPAAAERREQPISRREVEEVVATLRSMIDGMARMLDADREAERRGDQPPDD